MSHVLFRVGLGELAGGRLDDLCRLPVVRGPRVPVSRLVATLRRGARVARRALVVRLGAAQRRLLLLLLLLQLLGGLYMSNGDRWFRDILDRRLSGGGQLHEASVFNPVGNGRDDHLVDLDVASSGEQVSGQLLWQPLWLAVCAWAVCGDGQVSDDTAESLGLLVRERQDVLGHPLLEALGCEGRDAGFRAGLALNQVILALEIAIQVFEILR